MVFVRFYCSIDHQSRGETVRIKRQNRGGIKISDKNWSSLGGKLKSRHYCKSRYPVAVDEVVRSEGAMRIMQIPRFPRSLGQISNLESLIKLRLTGKVVMWSQQAMPLIGYMTWPNNPVARSKWLDSSASEILRELPRGFKTIQQHWARVADILHLHFDLASGGHQKRRGGASVGKAISLIAANAKSKGTGTAKLWEIWKVYKDVAHLVAAAVVISAEAQTRHRMAPCGLKLHELQPYRIAKLLPDLVISVAMAFEQHGLDYVSHGRQEPLFDPKSLWRIPADINQKLLPPPIRKITGIDLGVLNARRAGNRGNARSRKTTPVFN